MRPPGRTTRTISATAAAGSASHWSVRSARTASKASSGSSREARIAHGEAHATTRGSGVRPSDAQHLLGRVDADDLAAVTEVLGERERGFAEAAADIEEAFATGQAELVSLPGPQPARRVPPGGSLHRGEEHRDVRIVIDSPVAQPVRVLRPHAARVRRAPTPTILSARPLCFVACPTSRHVETGRVAVDTRAATRVPLSGAGDAVRSPSSRSRVRSGRARDLPGGRDDADRHAREGWEPCAHRHGRCWRLTRVRTMHTSPVRHLHTGGQRWRIGTVSRRRGACPRCRAG